MAAAAIAAHTLGFDGTVARLVCDPRLEAHVIDVEVRGKPLPSGHCFACHTRRDNPAPPGAITGQATFVSFLSSLLEAGGRGAGVHMC
jgi:aspartate dehydrogenase